MPIRYEDFARHGDVSRVTFVQVLGSKLHANYLKWIELISISIFHIVLYMIIYYWLSMYFISNSGKGIRFAQSGGPKWLGMAGGYGRIEITEP